MKGESLDLLLTVLDIEPAELAGRLKLSPRTVEHFARGSREIPDKQRTRILVQIGAVMEGRKTCSTRQARNLSGAASDARQQVRDLPKAA